MVIKRLLEKNYKIVMVIPFIIFTLMLLVYPLVQVVITSTTNYGITRAGSYIGISNYLELMKDDVFLQSVLITAKFTITTMTFSMIIGVILAVVFRTIKLPKKKIIMGLMVIPMLMTPSAIGLLWQQMFNPLFGIINKILSFFSLPTSLWISSSKTVIGSLCIVGIWRVTPFIFLVCSAGISMIPKELFEAGKIDGTDSFQQFIYITIPSLRSLLVIAFIFQLVTVLKVFDEIYVMTAGGPSSSSLTTYLYAYQTTFLFGRVGYGSAIGLILFLIILILGYLSINVKGKLQ